MADRSPWSASQLVQAQMPSQAELRKEMSLVRNRGLANASALAERVERLSDWREHVRAHPLPLALAAGALAFWMVPKSRSQSATARTEAMASTASSTKGSGTGNAAPTEREAKVAGIAGIGGAAMGFLGSLIGNAVRNYVGEQIQTLITSRGNHAPPQQRQTPLSRF